MSRSDNQRALTLLAEVFSELGYLEERSNDYQSAAANYLKSIDTFKKCSASDTLSAKAGAQVLSAYTGLIEIHVYFGRFTEALSYSQRVLEVIEQLSAAEIISKAEGSRFKAEVFCRMGDINVEFGKYREALDQYDFALAYDPTDPASDEDDKLRYTCALAHIRKGDVLRTLGRYIEALVILEKAILSFEKMLLKNPSDFHNLFSKGLAISNLAQLNFDLGQLRRAFDLFSESNHLYDNALMSRPGDIKALHNKSVSLVSNSSVAAHLGLQDSARAFSDEAISILKSIVRRGKRGGMSQAVLATASAQTASLLIKIGERNQGLNMYSEVIGATEQALSDRPQDARLRNTLGVICREYGNGLLDTGDLVGATNYCRKALVHFSEALELAPEQIDAMSNSASTLRQLGEIYRKQNRTFHALRNIMRAQGQFARLTELTSSNVAVLNNLSNCWRSFAEILASKGFGDRKRVLQAYDRSLGYLSQGVAEGESFLCMYNQSSVLLSLAQVLAEWTGAEDAIAACRDSIKLAKQVRESSPAHLEAAKVEAMASFFLGDQLMKVDKRQEALANYLHAIRVFESILEAVPTDPISRKHLAELNLRISLIDDN